MGTKGRKFLCNILQLWYLTFPHGWGTPDVAIAIHILMGRKGVITYMSPVEAFATWIKIFNLA